MCGFLRLVYHGDGVICPVTFAMHAAAAFEKPCVIIAGGREPWWWAAYVNPQWRHFGDECAPLAIPHRFLHTIGRLDCCRMTGCWKTELIANDWNDNNRLCELPVNDGYGQTIPRCLHDISTSDVADALMSYFSSS
jgi:hypothetical protein